VTAGQGAYEPVAVTVLMTRELTEKLDGAGWSPPVQVQLTRTSVGTGWELLVRTIDQEARTELEQYVGKVHAQYGPHAVIPIRDVEAYLEQSRAGGWPWSHARADG
jgi:hypothetical protein